MSDIPDLPGLLSASELSITGDHLAGLQTASGMIPWFPGGHCDPWNHVESAMALSVVGRWDEAVRAYGWLAKIQRSDGSWHNYYLPDGVDDDTIEDDKLDTNVCAYIATGVWHHWLVSSDRSAVERLWPTVERALDWVLAQRRDDGLPLWAVRPDDRPWGYALLTGTCSIQRSLRCGAALADALGTPRLDWRAAAETMTEAIQTRRTAFEPKDRWAMDWYYPALTGALKGSAAADRLVEGYATFALDRHGIRCVSDEPWVTASETAEASIAYSVVGDAERATRLLAATRPHRLASGAYLTGIVYPERVVFPAAEHSSYTAAAVVLAADAIACATPGARVFAG